MYLNRLPHKRNMPFGNRYASDCKSRRSAGVPLLGFEEKDRAVAQVEVDKVLGLVRDEGAKVATYDTVPGWSSAIIEL